MKLAVAYLRRSTDKQDLTFEVQREAILRWAKSNDVTVTSWHEDEASGGTDIDKRPGLMAATEALDGADYLVVAKIDRLARDSFTSALVERLCQRKGASVASADGAGNGDGPEAQLMRSLLAAFASYERALIRTRTKAALAAKRARGESTGGASPYGFTVDAGRLVPSDTEAEAVARARELRRQGLALRTIGAMLTSEGYLPRTGTTWHPTTLARIVGRVA